MIHVLILDRIPSIASGIAVTPSFSPCAIALNSPPPSDLITPMLLLNASFMPTKSPFSKPGKAFATEVTRVTTAGITILNSPEITPGNAETTKLTAPVSIFGRFVEIAEPKAVKILLAVFIISGSFFPSFFTSLFTPFSIMATPLSESPPNTSVMPSMILVIDGRNDAIKLFLMPLIAVCISCRLS